MVAQISLFTMSSFIPARGDPLCPDPVGVLSSPLPTNRRPKVFRGNGAGRWGSSLQHPGTARRGRDTTFPLLAFLDAGEEGLVAW